MTAGISPLAPVAAASSLKANPPRSKSPPSFAGVQRQIALSEPKECPQTGPCLLLLGRMPRWWVICWLPGARTSGGTRPCKRCPRSRSAVIQQSWQKTRPNYHRIFGKRPHEPFGIELSPALKAFDVYERIFEIILVNGPTHDSDKSYLSHHKAFFCLIGLRLWPVNHFWPPT